MASSKSATIRKAQIPSFCHLCEDSQNIQWKCVDCDLLMCSKCKTKVHSKFKAADDHDVISLKDVSFGIEQKGKINLNNIACKIHKGQKVCLYCHACRKMACPNCVTEKHKRHDLEDLRKVYDDRVCNLEYLCDEMKADLQFVDEEENKQSVLRSQNAKAKQDIVSQKDTLIKLVELEATHILQKLERVQQDNAMSSTVAGNLRFKEDTKSKISTVEAALNGSDIDKIINADRDLIPALLRKSVLLQDKNSSLLKFVPGKIDQKQISQMFGLVNHTDMTDESELTMNILVSHKTNFGVVSNLYSCKDGNVFMFDNKDTLCMKKMQLQSHKIKALKETKDVEIFDIIEIKENEFLVSFVADSKLKRLSRDGKFEDFLDLSPLLPRALSLTRSGKLLVSVRDQGDAFPLKSSSQRKLLLMKTDGQIIHEYNLDDQNKRLFTHVYIVINGINNEIYLIDLTSNNNDGRVLALGYPNKIVWKYTGLDSSKTKFPFRPSGIVTTEFGSIVVADRDNNILHILNRNGTLRRFIDVGEQDICFPYSLTIDAMGLLWIGCSTPKGEAIDAMLHVVKFSGF